jgi:hypothetical protein
MALDQLDAGNPFGVHVGGQASSEIAAVRSDVKQAAAGFGREGAQDGAAIRLL